MYDLNDLKLETVIRVKEILKKWKKEEPIFSGENGMIINATKEKRRGKDKG